MEFVENLLLFIWTVVMDIIGVIISYPIQFVVLTSALITIAVWAEIRENKKENR